MQQITEKFHRNCKKPANLDIAMRQFSIADNTIFMQFHYAENAVTASTRTFIKPPKPDYRCEVIFVETDTKAYNVYTSNFKYFLLYICKILSNVSI